MPAGQRHEKFPLVQGLRALAAFAVAWLHILYNALALSPHAGMLRFFYTAMPWNAGVDVFFVISGFVIVVSSRPLFAAASGARRFLIRRISRIVPLYWLMTTLFLMEFLVLPGAIHGDIGGPVYIAASYLFIPLARPDGVVQPVLGLGWTLNYEMFFYLVFAAFLVFEARRAVFAAAAALAALVALGLLGLLPGVALNFWANPIILEFCAGMFLALLPGRIPLGAMARLGLLGLALALLAGQPAWPRVLGYGLPAAALVAAATLGRPGRVPRAEALLARLGDASYAMYLVHPFVMRGAALAWLRAHRPGGVIFYVLFCLLLAQALALALHALFERRATLWLRHKLEFIALRPR